MERGHHESSRDLQPRDTVSPQPPHRERAGEIGTQTHSVLLLIYSRGFLLAEPNRKWEGEEAHWCSHTGRQPWDTQQVGKGEGWMWKGKWEVPYTTALASFITDMPSSFVPSQVLPTLFPVNGSPTCLTVISSLFPILHPMTQGPSVLFPHWACRWDPITSALVILLP